MGDTDSPGGMEGGGPGYWEADTDLVGFKATCCLFPFLLGQIHLSKQLILFGGKILILGKVAHHLSDEGGPSACSLSS